MKISSESDKVTITLDSEKDAITLLKIYDYAKYISLTKGIRDVSDEQIQELSDEVNQ